MMNDNLAYPLSVIRNSLVKLKKKSTQINSSLDAVDSELDVLVSSAKKKTAQVRNSLAGLTTEMEFVDAKFENLLKEMEVYKARLERETSKEVRRLERELEQARKSPVFTNPTVLETDPDSLRVASTISILECVVRSICGGADDFRLASYSFLFPAVFERVVRADEEAYLLEKIPSSALLVVQRGREYLEWTRSECDTHLTNPRAWEKYAPMVCDWWRNDALPLLYGARDEQWDTDEPMALIEMLSWQDDVAGRPLNFSPVWDAYEIYTKHKDEVYESSGVRAFEVKMFSFHSSQNEN
jgi:hypothetical protein